MRRPGVQEVRWTSLTAVVATWAKATGSAHSLLLLGDRINTT